MKMTKIAGEIAKSTLIETTLFVRLLYLPLFSLNQFYRDNYLKFYIYYEELSYELMEQKPSYDLMVLLGMYLRTSCVK